MKTTKKNIISILLVLITFISYAADRYWVGGNGDWNTTTHWSSTSGGAGGSSVPTSSDNAIFNSASSSSNYTVNMVDGLVCNNLTIGAPSSGKVYISYPTASRNLNIYGNLSIPAGISGFKYFDFTPYLIFNGNSGTNTISTNGVPLPISGIIFNGGGNYQLLDHLYIRDVQCTLSLVSGTFDSNGQTISILFTQWLILNGSLTFNTLDLSTVSGEYIQLNSNINADIFSLNGYNTYSITGFSKAWRTLIKSNTATIQRTITAATVIFKNADFQDISGSGSANWDLSAISGGAGDCDGNSGIILTPPSNFYWYKNSGSWSDTTKWFTLSHGQGTGNGYPLPQDTAIFDTASFASIPITTPVVSFNTQRSPTIKWIGVRRQPQWQILTNCMMYGSLSLDSSITFPNNGKFTFSRRGYMTIETKKVTINLPIVVDAIGGTLSIIDDLTMLSSKNISLVNGSIIDNNKNISTGGFVSSNSNVRTLSMGTGLWTLVGNDGATTTWNITNSTNLTFTSSGTILINNTSVGPKSFYGGGLNYNILVCSGNNIIIKDSNTFDTLTLDNAGQPTGLKFVSGTTQTVSNFTTSNTGTSLSKISATFSGSKFTLSKSSGVVSVDYMSIKDSEAIGGATWNAGTHSVDVSGNSGWIF